MPNIKTDGSASKALVERILPRIVSATRALKMCQFQHYSYIGIVEQKYPTPTAPPNSIAVAIIIACFIVNDLEETEVAKEFATSFAPVLGINKILGRGEENRSTDVPSIEESKDHANGKDVVKLFEDCHFDLGHSEMRVRRLCLITVVMQWHS